MFLIMGVSQGEKKLDFHQKIVCPCCGRYGSYQVSMTYMCFSLFFLPLLKWNKRYFAGTSCCNSDCEIDPELGKGIKSGIITELNQSDLHFDCLGQTGRQCSQCGYVADADFRFCPKCGREF